MLNEPTTIFVVEDDPVYAKLVQYVASMNPEHEVHCFENGKDCLDNLHRNPDIISMDYGLNDLSGEELMKQIHAFDKNIGVVILSGQQDISIAVDMLKNGAYDYIVKGDQVKERLFNTIENLKRKISLQLEVQELRAELSEKYSVELEGIIGRSRSMKKVIALIQKAVKTNITVSITGETGSGKEVVARAIHYNSKRSTGKFVAVNVAAIPNELLESELFGYEKGAFTGASSRKHGKFEIANGGTLFLDEIGEMNPNLQAKLLRAVQEREIVRLGGNEPISFDARIIVATHRDLAKEVQEGRFREDLYYRMLGLPIKVPPLRERGNDLVLLMRHFLDEFTKENKMPKMKVSSGAKKKLIAYDFPGNVRELKAIIELAAVLAEGKEIGEEDISFKSLSPAANLSKQNKTLKEYTADLIHLYLDEYNNDVRKVAKKLDVGKSTIYRMLKEEANLKKQEIKEG